MPCRNPCRLYIHLVFTYSIGPSSIVWSELGPTLPFPAMTMLGVWWSRALNLVCEVALSVMAASWFFEKSGWIGKVEDVKPVLLKTKLDFNWQSFWGGGFYPHELWNRQISSDFDSSRAGCHVVLGFRLFVRCRLVAVWWMANMQSVAALLHFMILLHWKTGMLINAQVLGRLSLQWRRN
jgi:hypothetical protein